jgi:hypothetical protein
LHRKLRREEKKKKNPRFWYLLTNTLEATTGEFLKDYERDSFACRGHSPF